MQIGTRIKEKLIELNMSAKELSERSGVPNSTLSDLINNKIKNASIQNAKKIAVVLNCTLDFLLDNNVNDEQKAFSKDEIELLNLYQSLDFEDKAILRGEARGMLRNSKYNKKPQRLSC